MLETLLLEKDQLEAEFQKLKRVDLAAETPKRQRAEMLCQQTLFQTAKGLAVEKEARKASEDLSASLQEQLGAMARKCEELLLKKEKRKSAEELCATLRGQQLATLFRTTQKLDAEKALRKAAEDQLAILQDVLETVTVEKDELQAQLQTQNSGSVLRRGV